MSININNTRPPTARTGARKAITEISPSAGTPKTETNSTENNPSAKPEENPESSPVVTQPTPQKESITSPVNYDAVLNKNNNVSSAAMLALLPLMAQLLFSNNSAQAMPPSQSTSIPQADPNKSIPEVNTKPITTDDLISTPQTVSEAPVDGTDRSRLKSNFETLVEHPKFGEEFSRAFTQNARREGYEIADAKLDFDSLAHIEDKEFVDLIKMTAHSMKDTVPYLHQHSFDPITKLPDYMEKMFLYNDEPSKPSRSLFDNVEFVN